MTDKFSHDYAILLSLQSFRMFSKRGVAMMQILTYGLEPSQVLTVENVAKKHDVTVMDSEVYTDLIAIPAVMLVINEKRMGREELDTILSFYHEIEKFSESVIILSDQPIKRELTSKIIIYDNFEAFKNRLDYHVLDCLRTEKKAKQFSKTLANSIVILKMIRSNEGISTQELAEKLELSPRTIQRYIETLRVAGEWIEYDPYMRGWRIINNESILLEDI